jgi:hypothetical protein
METIYVTHVAIARGTRVPSGLVSRATFTPQGGWSRAAAMRPKNGAAKSSSAQG